MLRRAGQHGAAGMEQQAVAPCTVLLAGFAWGGSAQPFLPVLATPILPRRWPTPHLRHPAPPWSPMQDMSQLLENVFADPKGFGIGPDGRYRYEHPGFTAGTAEVS